MATQEFPKVGVRVLVSGGNKVGTVKSLVAAERGDEIAGFAVESGWLHKHVRFVPLDQVKWVNPDSVVLRLTRKAFEDLPERAEPAADAAAETQHGTAAG